MKKMWPVFIALFLMVALQWMAGTAAIGQDQCEVVGNSYALLLDGEEYTLTFTEGVPMFSPAPTCFGKVIFENSCGAGQVYDWSVNFGVLTVAGLKSLLTKEGLTIYAIPENLHTLRIGDVVYMTEQEVPLLLFK